MPNTKGLGRYQRDMLAFITRNDTNATDHGYARKRYSIARDRDTQRIATSLACRKLLLIDKSYECWTIRAAASGSTI